jgi:hypothetical protein
MVKVDDAAVVAVRRRSVNPTGAALGSDWPIAQAADPTYTIDTGLATLAIVKSKK